MNKDMSNPAVQAEYDTKILDGARELAFKYKQNISGMAAELNIMGVPSNLIAIVSQVQGHPDYAECINYRGKMVDEVLIEALKDCLRPINGF